MKKVLFLLIFFPLMVRADSGFNMSGLRTVRDSAGKFTVEYDRTRDLNGLRDFMVRGAGSEYAESATVSSTVKSGVTGAVSTTAVNATVTKTISKDLVKKAVFDAAKSVGKGAFKLANPIGKALFAWEIVDALAKAAGFLWNDDRSVWEKQADDTVFKIIITNELNGLGESLTEEALDNICNGSKGSSINLDGPGAPVRCMTAGYVKGSDKVGAAMSAACKSIGGNGQFDNIGGCFKDKDNGRSRELMGLAVKWVKIIGNHIPLQQSDIETAMDADADAHPDNYIKAADLPQDKFSKPKVLVLPGQITQSNPYTDPQDGKAKQTRWKFGDNGEVSEETLLRPDLKPNSPEAPASKVDTDTPPDSSSGDKDKPKDDDDKKQPDTESDLCKLHPDIMACDKQPDTPKSASDIRIPVETHDLLFAPDNIFPSSGICPAPISFTVSIPFSDTQTFAFDTAPACDVAARLRGIIIALAWLAASVLCIRALKTE